MNRSVGSVLTLTAAFVVIASAAVVGIEREQAPRQVRTPDQVALTAELAELDAYLADRGVSEACFTPRAIEAGTGGELERCFALLGNFFERTERLVESEPCKAALESGASVASETPRLAVSRHRTNVLCARAWYDLERSGDSHAAGRRIAQALDLIRLGDDGQWLGGMITIANENIVLGTLQRMLRDARVDGGQLRGALGDRLASLSSPQRLDAIARMMASVYGPENESRLVRAQRELARAALEVAARGADAELDAARAGTQEHLQVREADDSIEICADEVLADYGLDPGELRGRPLRWTVAR